MFKLSKIITPTAMQELRNAFKEFDHNGDESISKDELAQVMKRFDSVSESEVEQMIQLVDVNGDGGIDFKEFLQLMENNVTTMTAEDEVKTLFDAIDTDGDGSITEDEITKMMRSLGEKVDSKDIRRMLKEGDKTNTGKITFVEFKSMMGDLNHLKSTSTFQLSHTISHTAMQELRNAFKEFDHNGDESISKDELARVMKKFDSFVSEAEVEQMIQLVDVNGDGGIDFKEFLQLMENNSAPQSPDDEIQLLFGAIDTDGDGYITEEEIAIMMKNLGEKVSKKDIRKMLKEGDKKKDGKISFVEFKSMMDGLIK